MKRRLLLISLALPFLVNQKPASALVPVTCDNCSQEVTTLLGYARQAEQLANEVNTLKTEVAQYANMVTNTASLPVQLVSQVVNTVGQVRSLANQASLLAGGSSSIIGRLNAAQGIAYQAAACRQMLMRSTGRTPRLLATPHPR
jgi:P-type conjugative transfer protein TrbJ